MPLLERIRLRFYFLFLLSRERLINSTTLLGKRTRLCEAHNLAL